MAGREVRAPDGTTWHVRRRWLPRLGSETLPARFWRRVQGTVRGVLDIAEGTPDVGCLEIFGEGLVVGVLVILAVVLAVFVVVPFLVALLDLALLVLLLLIGAVARVLFRRPWVVHASADGGQVRSWNVVGWRASGALVDDVASRLEAGVSLPPVEPAP